jgi:putative DNA primase/helicase
MDEAKGLMMGGGHYSALEPRKYLYHLIWLLLNITALPLAVTNFGKAITAAARNMARNISPERSRRRQTNVGISELADEFMPRAYALNSQKTKNRIFKTHYYLPNG